MDNCSFGSNALKLMISDVSTFTKGTFKWWLNIGRILCWSREGFAWLWYGPTIKINNFRSPDLNFEKKTGRIKLVLIIISFFIRSNSSSVCQLLFVNKACTRNSRMYLLQSSKTLEYMNAKLYINHLTLTMFCAFIDFISLIVQALIDDRRYDTVIQSARRPAMRAENHCHYCPAGKIWQ